MPYKHTYRICASYIILAALNIYFGDCCTYYLCIFFEATFFFACIVATSEFPKLALCSLQPPRLFYNSPIANQIIIFIYIVDANYR